MAPEPNPPTQRERIEPVVWLLFGGTVLFAAMLVVVSKWSPDDGQTFTVLSGLTTGFASALMIRVKLPDGKKPEGPA